MVISMLSLSAKLTVGACEFVGGFAMGLFDGTAVGAVVGAVEGLSLGTVVGAAEGPMAGLLDGGAVGRTVGIFDSDGWIDGGDGPLGIEDGLPNELDGELGGDDDQFETEGRSEG